MRLASIIIICVLLSLFTSSLSVEKLTILELNLYEDTFFNSWTDFSKNDSFIVIGKYKHKYKVISYHERIICSTPKIKLLLAEMYYSDCKLHKERLKKMYDQSIDQFSISFSVKLARFAEPDRFINVQKYYKIKNTK